MTDIVERLRTDGAMKGYYDVPALQRDAADEIERLRGWVMQLSVKNGRMEDEIARLESCLRWEQNWLSRVGTHSEGCWQWGPGHYQCALRHIEDLTKP